jgi:hypothetical protein
MEHNEYLLLEKEAATCASEFPTISDYANGNQYSSDQGVNENEN